MLHCIAPHHNAFIYLADISYLSLSAMLSWGCTRGNSSALLGEVQNDSMQIHKWWWGS
jgi:hypothetical protein